MAVASPPIWRGLERRHPPGRTDTLQVGPTPSFVLLLVVLGWAVMARAPSWVAFAVIAAQVATFAIFWWNPPFANIHLEEGVAYGFNPSFGLLLIAAAVAMSIAVAGSTGPSSTVDQPVG